MTERQGKPTLADLRRAFQVGMSRDEFYATCDDLLPLEMTALGTDLLGIHVADGGYVTFFVSADKGLFYAEYQGDSFFPD